MNKLIALIGLVVLVNIHSAFANPNIKDEIISYEFKVEIISGSEKNNVYDGSFSLNKTFVEMNKKGELYVPLLSFDFFYNGKIYTKSNFDPVYNSLPKAKFINGEFVKIIAVGGDSKNRFGFNGGFNRFQFGRDSEKYIVEGKDYFGYLDEKTYVDGAAKIKYTKKE